MKNLQAILLMLCVAIASSVTAQTTPVPSQPTPGQPVPAQTVPQTSPQQIPTTTDDDKKADFNSPQSPTRSPQTPSEDTLIKGQKSGGAVINDSMMPSSDKKKDRMNRRKNRKGTAETDDSTAVQPGETKKP